MSDSPLPFVWQTPYELEALRRRCESERQTLLIAILLTIRQSPGVCTSEIEGLTGLPAEQVRAVLDQYDAGELHRMLADCVVRDSGIYRLLTRESAGTTSINEATLHHG